MYEVEDDENRYSSGDKGDGSEMRQKSRRKNNQDTGNVIGVGHTMNILSILSENSQDSPCLESYSIANLPNSRSPTPCLALQRSSTPLSSHSRNSHGIGT